VLVAEIETMSGQLLESGLEVVIAGVVMLKRRNGEAVVKSGWRCAGVAHGLRRRAEWSLSQETKELDMMWRLPV
jgi:hypothetical protein